MKKVALRLSPFSAIEVCYATKIAKLLGYVTQSIPNNNGKFSSIIIKSDKKFKHDDIKIIIDKFNIRFNKHIHFEKTESSVLYNIGCLTITEN